MLDRFSLLYVQTLFYLTLLTLGLPTECILLRFVNGLINGSSSSSSIGPHLKQQKSFRLTHNVQKSRCALTRRAAVLINFVVHNIVNREFRVFSEK